MNVKEKGLLQMITSSDSMINELTTSMVITFKSVDEFHTKVYICKRKIQN